MRQDFYQMLLIASGVVVTGLFGVFLYREIYPEYKIYQKDYIALEEFRSSYTHENPPPFQMGVKQIVIEREDKGPPIIDRCTSCHVALQIPYFSPTKLSRDINGNIIRDADGKPIQIPNEDYIWAHLDQKIAELRDEKVNEQLVNEGQSSVVKQRLKQADTYEALKTAKVGDNVYQVEKVLAMHPLIGKETRPFEFHPIEEYACTVCHNGNGRGLVTDKAHGPIFDGQYEEEEEGPIPQFTESDPENDPPFAHVFNAKPGHELLFQTQPLFVGALIQSKCMQCHQNSQMLAETTDFTKFQINEKRKNDIKTLLESFEKDKQTVKALLKMRQLLSQDGYQSTIVYFENRQNDYQLSKEDLEDAAFQEKYLKAFGTNRDPEAATQLALNDINQQLVFFLGSPRLEKLLGTIDPNDDPSIDQFLKDHQQDADSIGILFKKAETLAFEQDLIQHTDDVQTSFSSAIKDQSVVSNFQTDIDDLTKDFQRGKELYLSQACYACHRISGLARGGVGPELTRIGDHYPWYIKQSMVWPQADLRSSTMPNMRLDHEELEDLMTFLLAQKGSNRAVAQSVYQASLQAWEAGRRLPWEKPISPAQMQDLNYSMTVFVTEGCASCHRLLGYQSNVGFKIEKNNPSFDQLYEEQQWFKKLFPEEIRISQYDEPLPGSTIVDHIEKHAQEIDDRIVSDVRQHSIIEEIEKNHPESIEALYSNFRYASRAKDHYYAVLADQEKDPEKKARILSEHQAWKDRVHRVLMTYIQVYGLGRLIGPRPNWSGVYRTDQWLMEHFHNPSAHVPRSIMPVMPFDDTKFYALTYMLDVLGIRNKNSTRDIWKHRGFNPQEAFEIHCVQCHGQSMAGNGAVAEWIYPIPKSLHNADFLRNLTRERAIYSIVHGIKGTPMPPFGEIAKDKPAKIQEEIGHIPVLTEAEIEHLVDWLFASLSGEEVIKEETDVPKWQYQPKDVLEELKREGGELQQLPVETLEKMKKEDILPERELPQENVPPPRDESVVSMLPTGEGLYAAIRPEIYPRTSPRNVKHEYSVDEVFDVFPSPEGDPDPYKYYIKKKYYTPYNIQEGQKFFLLNCAVCHGNEGDGSGARSLAMQEAKPRMLTNIDWMHSRDDLRFLRSIKYGVAGTAMTPWGDLTNSLQRIQLVIFIRTLIEEQNNKEQLDSALYQTFERPQILIETARVQQNQLLIKTEKERKTIKEQQLFLEKQVVQGKASDQEVLQLYQKNLDLEQSIKQMQDFDNLYLDLKAEIRKEKELYFNLGMSLINKKVDDQILTAYLNIIRLNEDRYTIKDDRLVINENPQFSQKMEALQEKIVSGFDQHISYLEQRKNELQSKTNATKKTEELSTIEADLNGFIDLRKKVLIDINEALRFVEKQKEIVNLLNQTNNHK